MAERYILEPGKDRERLKSQAIAFINRLPADKSHFVEVGEYRKPRTNKQNSALYGLAEKKLMDFMGERGAEAKARIHADLCCGYFGEVKTLTGRKPKRTTTKNEAGEDDVLNTAQMADFFDWIQQTAAEFGCDIPDPDPLYRQRGRWQDEQADQMAA